MFPAFTCAIMPESLRRPSGLSFLGVHYATFLNLGGKQIGNVWKLSVLSGQNDLGAGPAKWKEGEKPLEADTPECESQFLPFPGGDPSALVLPASQFPHLSSRDRGNTPHPLSWVSGVWEMLSQGQLWSALTLVRGGKPARTCQSLRNTRTTSLSGPPFIFLPPIVHLTEHTFK